MTKISALIVAHNEEHNIEDCLKSLLFVDEIVVILDKSTDATKEIVKKHTKNIIEGSWDIEGVRRNLGIQKCSYEWVLEIDADERVSKELANEIIEAVKEPKYDYFKLNMDNYLGSKHIKYGWLRTMGVLQKQILFKKEIKKYHEDKQIHPDFDIKGNCGSLANNLTHKMDKDIASLIARFNRNTSWRASDILSQNSNFKYSFLREIYSLKFRFFKSFFIKKGYKHGLQGLLVSLLCGLYPFVSRLKAQELNNNKIQDENSQSDSN